MKVVHFCSYFYTSTVFKNLITELNRICKNEVLVPYKMDFTYIGFDRKNYQSDGIDIKSFPIFSIFTRLFFSLKVVLYFFSALWKSVLSKPDVVHAHTLYSDGVAACFFAKFKKTRLVVTVRNTDINYAARYLPHYKPLIHYVLNSADKIIFISIAHKARFEEEFGIAYSEKLTVISNGLESFYIENSLMKKSGSDECNAVFVGALNKNKNIKSAIQAFDKVLLKLNKSGAFFVVGGDEKKFNEVYGVFETKRVSLKFLGRLENTEIVSVLRASSIFIMPSFHETFGLVYLEAISQCVPVVFSAGEGIDNLFENGQFGFRCDPRVASSIEESIYNCLLKFPSGLSFEVENVVNRFSWASVAASHFSKVY